MSTGALTPHGFIKAFEELAAWLQANDNFQGKSWSREQRRKSAELDMRHEAVLGAWASLLRQPRANETPASRPFASIAILH